MAQGTDDHTDREIDGEIRARQARYEECAALEVRILAANPLDPKLFAASGSAWEQALNRRTIK